MKRIREEHSSKVQALADSGDFTYQDICNAFDNLFTINQIKYHIKKYYPESKKNIKKEYSRGGSKLEQLLKQIFPYNKIKSEFPLGNKLRVDFVVLPPYNLAFEFDGTQHANYTSHFHGDKSGFSASKQRDHEKEELLALRGINLIRIESLDIDFEAVNQLIKQTGYGAGNISDEHLTPKEKSLQRQKEYRKKAQEVLRQRAKEQRKAVKVNESFNSSYKDEMKLKQKEFRKESYKRQKQWMKENKK